MYKSAKYAETLEFPSGSKVFRKGVWGITLFSKRVSPNLKRQRPNSQAAATKLSSGSDVISLLPACFGGVAVDYLFICRRGDAFCYEEFFCCDELEAVFEELRDCLTDSLDSFFVSGSVMH